ncbi:MAG: serine/threonine-protein kinase [Polyangiaceae bacterium]|nr:serine/threonine-protein kinase [Polyangiaceae bacterium]
MEFELKCGATLGRYQLLTQLGQGGMASVWVARERSFGGAERLVAVKVMLPALASRDDFRSMFLEEGQIVRSISHANVVSVFDVAEDYGILYMAMEWVEGDSLRTLIREARKRRAIPPEMAVRMIADTAAGLHAAHELRDWDGRLCGLVHCDVSPHNILIGLKGQAKLVDFGVASATARTDKSQDLLKGKLGYMSPEQVLGTGLDRRSDVFSLGVVLYELTTGERLFRGETAKDTLRLVAEAKVPRPTEVDSKYPEPLEGIVLRALARNVEERYQTAEDLRIALDRYLIHERILVPEAGVGRLLKRVLGARIEQQREAIRDALQAIDGHLENGLVPNDPTAFAEAPGDLSLSGKSSPFSDASFSSTPAPTSSFPSGPHSLTDPTGTASPQILEPNAPVGAVKKPRTALLGAAFAAVAALATGWIWLNAQSGSGPALRTLGSQASTAEGSEGEDADATKAEGAISAEEPQTKNPELAPTEAPSLAAPGAGQGVRPRKTSKAAERAGREAEEAVRAADGSRPLPATPTAAPPPPTPLLPNEKRPDLNRGAATAALGAGAMRAAACSKPGGPSGTGQASVTFHPDGYISAVTVSAPFAGSSVSGCITAGFKQSRIPPFRGGPLTLTRSFRVAE